VEARNAPSEIRKSERRDSKAHPRTLLARLDVARIAYESTPRKARFIDDLLYFVATKTALKNNSTGKHFLLDVRYLLG
jgi:hypothetical protein